MGLLQFILTAKWFSTLYSYSLRNPFTYTEIDSVAIIRTIQSQLTRIMASRRAIKRLYHALTKSDSYNRDGMRSTIGTNNGCKSSGG
jgi:hypothetical protein